MHVCRGDPEAQAEYDAIASAVFSNPPLASVGLSEEQATEEYGDVDVFTSSFKYAPQSTHCARAVCMTLHASRWIALNNPSLVFEKACLPCNVIM